MSEKLNLMFVANRLISRLFFSTMRMNLNLSRQPYTNRRLFWICLLAVLLGSASFAFWMAAENTRNASTIASLRSQIDTKQKSLPKLKQQASQNTVTVTQTVLTDEQKFQLASARQLIEQKSFSWNALLSDIEKHVPKQVRILSIKIAESAKPLEVGTVEIEIAAAGRAAAQMTEMMADIETSGGKFVVDQAEQQAPSEEGDVPFILRLIYRPGGQQ
jgi:Tfp pilus assembly protein PilN